MSIKKRVQRLERLAPDVADQYWESYWTNWWCRRLPKFPLNAGERGRTHKRKQRGARKRRNMSCKQLMGYFYRKDKWR